MVYNNFHMNCFTLVLSRNKSTFSVGILIFTLNRKEQLTSVLQECDHYNV